MVWRRDPGPPRAHRWRRGGRGEAGRGVSRISPREVSGEGTGPIRRPGARMKDGRQGPAPSCAVSDNSDGAPVPFRGRGGWRCLALPVSLPRAHPGSSPGGRDHVGGGSIPPARSSGSRRRKGKPAARPGRDREVGESPRLRGGKEAGGPVGSRRPPPSVSSGIRPGGWAKPHGVPSSSPERKAPKGRLPHGVAKGSGPSPCAPTGPGRKRRGRPRVRASPKGRRARSGRDLPGIRRPDVENRLWMESTSRKEGLSRHPVRSWPHGLPHVSPGSLRGRDGTDPAPGGPDEGLQAGTGPGCAVGDGKRSVKQWNRRAGA